MNMLSDISLAPITQPTVGSAADLEHLGPVGHDVYVQLNTAENFTPHSRCDIVAWNAT